MDDQEFKEVVLKEIKEAKAFRKNIKDALKKALYGDFDVSNNIVIGESNFLEQWEKQQRNTEMYTQQIGPRTLF